MLKARANKKFKKKTVRKLFLKKSTVMQKKRKTCRKWSIETKKNQCVLTYEYVLFETLV